jgi:hypothetical protein
VEPPSSSPREGAGTNNTVEAIGFAETLHSHGENLMEKKTDKKVRIELTEEQRKQLREQTGKEASAIEFQAEELEERVAPFDVLGGFVR